MFPLATKYSRNMNTRINWNWSAEQMKCSHSSNSVKNTISPCNLITKKDAKVHSEKAALEDILVSHHQRLRQQRYATLKKQWAQSLLQMEEEEEDKEEEEEDKEEKHLLSCSMNQSTLFATNPEFPITPTKECTNSLGLSSDCSETESESDFEEEWQGLGALSLSEESTASSMIDALEEADLATSTTSTVPDRSPPIEIPSRATMDGTSSTASQPFTTNSWDSELVREHSVNVASTLQEARRKRAESATEPSTADIFHFEL